MCILMAFSASNGTITCSHQERKSACFLMTLIAPNGTMTCSDQERKSTCISMTCVLFIRVSDPTTTKPYELNADPAQLL